MEDQSLEILVNKLLSFDNSGIFIAEEKLQAISKFQLWAVITEK